MAKRSKGGPPRHGAKASKAKKDPDAVVDEEHADAAEKRRPKTKITAERAMEIAEGGERLSREIEACLASEEVLVKKLTKVREDRKSKTRELITLWDDVRAGQGRLALVPPADDDAGADSSTGEDDAPSSEENPVPPGHAEAPAMECTHGENRLRVETRVAGQWNALVDGRQVNEKWFGSAGEAMDWLHAQRGIPKSLWRDIEWAPVTLDGPGPAPKNGAYGLRTHRATTEDGKVLEVTEDEIDGVRVWRATVDGNYGGEHSSVEKARRWAEIKAGGKKAPAALWAIEDEFAETT